MEKPVDKGKRNLHKWGEDFLMEDGYTINFVRVDDHNFKITIALKGEVAYNESATVSSDGKHYTRIRESVRSASKITFEYDRVDPEPTGDAF